MSTAYYSVTFVLYQRSLSSNHAHCFVVGFLKFHIMWPSCCQTLSLIPVFKSLTSKEHFFVGGVGGKETAVIISSQFATEQKKKINAHPVILVHMCVSQVGFPTFTLMLRGDYYLKERCHQVSARCRESAESQSLFPVPSSP